MLYALDLFSGIGGNSLGLKDYVRTVAYCEADRHAQAVLLSRMSDGSLPVAPICTDITGLDGYALRDKVDCIIAGFPCQDISVAGKGAGLDGQRSGLFYEVVRLAKEVEPTFLFLENVPAIRTRGLDRVVEELTEAGYDCRWTMLSASDVGAPHKRERWFLLAHTNNSGRVNQQEQVGRSEDQIQPRIYDGTRLDAGNCSSDTSSARNMAHTYQQHDKSESGSLGETQGTTEQQERRNGLISGSSISSRQWWAAEPDVGRVAHGVPQRVDRIKRLGNAVVPAQAKEAFEILMGIAKLKE